jgi:chromosome segregation ATPase
VARRKTAVKKPDANARIDALVAELNESLADAAEQINEKFDLIVEGVQNGFSSAQQVDQGLAIQIASIADTARELQEGLRIAQLRADKSVERATRNAADLGAIRVMLSASYERGKAIVKAQERLESRINGVYARIDTLEDELESHVTRPTRWQRVKSYALALVGRY